MAKVSCLLHILIAYSNALILNNSFRYSNTLTKTNLITIAHKIRGYKYLSLKIIFEIINFYMFYIKSEQPKKILMLQKILILIFFRLFSFFFNKNCFP